MISLHVTGICLLVQLRVVLVDTEEFGAGQGQGEVDVKLLLWDFIFLFCLFVLRGRKDRGYQTAGEGDG